MVISKNDLNFKNYYWGFHLENELKKKISDTKNLTCRFCASRCGMLLHTREGRVTKIEGNPEHPVSQGWSCSSGRASIAESVCRGN
jgi:anaerobic selenocysteine-containing dehydrogenase